MKGEAARTPPYTDEQREEALRLYADHGPGGASLRAVTELLTMTASLSESQSLTSDASRRSYRFWRPVPLELV